jgi:drug/metabolite transporter (DMT)-like permease
MKAGIKTTEFWLSLIAILLGVAIAIVSTVVGEGSTVGQALGVGASLLGAMGYTVPRLSLKKAEAVAHAIGKSDPTKPSTEA